MSRRLLLGSLWGFVALAFVAGVLAGVSLPLWQKAAMEADMRVLQKRLAAQATTSTVPPRGLEDAEAALASAEASVAALATDNMRLEAELASAEEALAAAQAKPSTATTKTATTTTTAGDGAVVERSVSPASVAANGSFTFTAKTKGSVSKVSMRIASASAAIKYDYTYSLTKGATSGGVTTWQRTIKAPGKAGAYRCIAIAYVGGRRDTASAVTLTVK